jgi:hypothetical protein
MLTVSVSLVLSNVLESGVRAREWVIPDASCGNGAFSPRIEIVRSAGGRCATVFGSVSSIWFPLSSYSVRERDLGFGFGFAKDSYRRPEFSWSSAWNCSEMVKDAWRCRPTQEQCAVGVILQLLTRRKIAGRAVRSLGWLAGHMEDRHSHGYDQATGRRDSFCDSQAAKSSLWKWARPRRWPTYSLLPHNLFLPNNSRFVKLMTTKWSTTKGKVQMNTVE